MSITLSFKILESQEGYKHEDYFENKTGHCTNKGYFIIAENVYNLINTFNIAQ